MQEFVKKLIERLEGESYLTTNDDGETNKFSVQVVEWKDIKKIVNQLAEEYENESVSGDLISRKLLIEKIWEKHKETEEHYDLFADELKDMFCGIVAMIDEMPTACNDGWIPCEKELPKDGVVVDLSCEYMGTPYETVGYFKNGNRGHSYIVDNDVFMRSAVLAWRPRPIPYQPSNSKNSNNWKQQTMSRFERVE